MIKRIVFTISLLASLAGCGNKGPLLMPDSKPTAVPAAPSIVPVQQPASASETTPTRSKQPESH